MNQQFIQYVQDASKIARRFPKTNWGDLLGIYFATLHSDILGEDEAQYDLLFDEAADMVQRLVGVELWDTRTPF